MKLGTSFSVWTHTHTHLNNNQSSLSKIQNSNSTSFVLCSQINKISYSTEFSFYICRSKLFNVNVISRSSEKYLLSNLRVSVIYVLPSTERHSCLTNILHSITSGRKIVNLGFNEFIGSSAKIACYRVSFKNLCSVVQPGYQCTNQGSPRAFLVA